MSYRPSARRLNEWMKAGKRGKVHTYTVAHINVDGTKLKKLIISAMVKIDNVHGEFVRKLGEVDSKDVEIGMRVEAVFKEKKDRVGSMLDIRYFKPVK